jgi:hypothetical protein
MLPQGLVGNQINVGPSNGGNLAVTFMDWLAVQEPNGKPAKMFRHVGPDVPGKQEGGEADQRSVSSRCRAEVKLRQIFGRPQLVARIALERGNDPAARTTSFGSSRFMSSAHKSMRVQAANR